MWIKCFWNSEEGGIITELKEVGEDFADMGPVVHVSIILIF